MLFYKSIKSVQIFNHDCYKFGCPQLILGFSQLFGKSKSKKKIYYFVPKMDKVELHQPKSTRYKILCQKQ